MQRAIWKAEQRAISSRRARASRSSRPRATRARTSRIRRGTDEPRRHDAGRPATITNDCVVIPVEIPGVIGVTADGNQRSRTASATSSRSTRASASARPTSSRPAATRSSASRPRPRTAACSRRGRPRCRAHAASGADGSIRAADAVYCYQQGTSMASPHAAGVAALIVSRYGNWRGPPTGRCSREGGVAPPADGRPAALPDALPAGYLASVGVDDGGCRAARAGPGTTRGTARAGERAQRDHSARAHRRARKMAPAGARIGGSPASRTPATPPVICAVPVSRRPVVKGAGRKAGPAADAAAGDRAADPAPTCARRYVPEDPLT